MLWQDRNGNWHSTVSPIDMKINQVTIEERSKVYDGTGDSLFQEMFGEFYSDC